MSRIFLKNDFTLREGEEGTLRSFINTATVGASRWEPPLVDEDWHAICHAIYKGVGGSGVGKVLPQVCAEIIRTVNVRHPSVNHRANTLWEVREAKEKGDALITIRTASSKLVEVNKEVNVRSPG